MTEDMPESETLEWLKDQCNRFANEKCMTLKCIRRGGFRDGNDSVDYDKSTCIPYEIYQTLKAENKSGNDDN